MKHSRMDRVCIGLALARLRMAGITLDAIYPKDPDPKNWRTIQGSKVHLKNGKIDGGAGGKFNGRGWVGKVPHEVTGEMGNPEPKPPATPKKRGKPPATPKQPKVQKPKAPQTNTKQTPVAKPPTAKRQRKKTPGARTGAKELQGFVSELESIQGKVKTKRELWRYGLKLDPKLDAYFKKKNIPLFEKGSLREQIIKYLKGGDIQDVLKGIDQLEAKWKGKDLSTLDAWKKTYDGHVKEIDQIYKKSGGRNTSKKLAEWLGKQGICKSPGAIELPENASVAIGVAKSAIQVFDKFPGLKKWHLSLGKMDEYCIQKHDGAYAVTTLIRDGCDVQYNPQYFESLDDLKKSYGYDLRKGFHPKGTTWESIITHEYGHVLDGMLTKTRASGRHRRKINFSEYVYDLIRAGDFEIEKGLSRYANTKYEEFFAEAIAEALTSPNPRRIATRVMEEVERFMNDRSLTF